MKRKMTRKILAIAGLCLGLFTCAPLLAQEAVETGVPSEQDFLERLAGEWQTTTETYLAPGQPPVETTGTESVRRLGETWVISDIESDFMGMPFSAVFTLGYDPETQEFVGTWVDSVSSYLWHYEGTLGGDGEKLTLESEGPCVLTPGEYAQYRDVLEIHGDGERTFTSRALIDGTWVPVVTIHSKRSD